MRSSGCRRAMGMTMAIAIPLLFLENTRFRSVRALYL
jgi:hypothetical protein